MYNNFKGKFKGQQLKKMFWKAALTYSVNQHLKTMAEIEKMYPKKNAEQTPYEWLAEIPPVHWARCFFLTKTKFDVLVNNMNESFNHIILEARELPIIQMFEWIRRKFMGRIQVKREEMKKYKGVVCPNIMKKTEVQRLENRNCFPSWAGEDKYELVGYPCCHAIAAIDYHRLKVEDFIDECFKKEVYLKVYNHMIHPVPGMHDFEDSKMGKVDPPNVVIKMGRPKKCRRKDANDVRETTSRRGFTHTCAICLRKGHNKRSCTNPPHPKSKFKQNPNQGRQRSSKSHGASRSRRPSTPPYPPFNENETIQEEVPPIYSQPSQDSMPEIAVQPPLPVQPQIPVQPPIPLQPPPQTASRQPFKSSRATLGETITRGLNVHKSSHEQSK
ncbi:uncharacterized protein LOC105162263 isoform X2 [Sesamum indicum]|uniref:Uncharacterized protein LOC105162263 isoform X2 n=1 Tax=Sesamum indicum TaxID=4182 RepID=A0A8M8V0W4_SESIN|nr:uncharacterized protein LOC105162263 isoform X2 [Sesamum indicum]